MKAPGRSLHWPNRKVSVPGPRTLDEIVLDAWTATRDRAYQVLREPDDAEDLASDVMMSVMARLENDPASIVDPEDMGAFIRRAVMNQVIDRQKSGKRREVRDRRLLIELEKARRTWGNPERELEERAQRMEIDRAVAHLPEKAQQVWYLKQVEELSTAEIGERLSIKAATVRAHIFLANKALRLALRAAAAPKGGPT